MQVSPGDLDFLATNGYVTSMQKDAYDRAVADVATLAQRSTDLQREQMDEAAVAASLQRDVRKTHSIMFHFERRDQKAADLAAVTNERAALSKDMADVVEKDSEIKQLILMKSTIDRMASYNGGYLALTGLGVVTLNDLNVRNYRVSDMEFQDFIGESKETIAELKSIAQIGRSDVAALQQTFPEADPSQLWSVSIGLAKLQGDQNQINRRFGISLGILQHLKSTPDNKMMAAEIMTSLTANPLYGDNSDLPGLGKTLENLDHDLRHHAHVPNQLSAGVAALILFGRRHDGTFPIDRFMEFTKITRSYESAAIMSVLTTPIDQLETKFLAFRQLFGFWGFQMSEDTELASAFLTISDFVPSDVSTKMSIILSALKTYLEYPLVATAILTSIPTFEANETLDLMEKTYSLLWPYAQGLQRSELISLSVRMIHGIRNELVKQLDPTAKISNTPVQFTHAPSPIFFFYGPLIIAHSAYYSTFSGIGGAHPAHVHGYGGGFGG